MYSKRTATISDIILLLYEIKFSLYIDDSKCSIEVSDFVSNMVFQLNRVLDLDKLKNDLILVAANFLYPRYIDFYEDKTLN